MRVEAKKKALSNAISDVRGLTEALELTEGSATSKVRLYTDGKALKIASMYAEATVSDVTVEAPGDVALELDSLMQALSVSGSDFKISKDKTGVHYSCGRVNGSIAISDTVPDGTFLQNAPKTNIHVPHLKALLAGIALKATGRATDRTLHFDAKGKSLRGESTDSFRGIVLKVNVDKDSKIPSNAALSLPQKAADAMAKHSADAMVGFNDAFFAVKWPGLRAVIPLSSVQPLDIQGQIVELFGDKPVLGTAVFKTSELKDALADAISAVGKANAPNLSLHLSNGSKDCVFKGEAASGEATVSCQCESNDLGYKSLTLNLAALYLKECLDFYTEPQVKCTVYDQGVLLDLAAGTEVCAQQTTLVPLLSVIPEGEIKKAKPAPTPAPEPEDEPEAEDAGSKNEPDEAPAPPPNKPAPAKKPKPTGESASLAPKKPAKAPPPPEPEDEAADEDEDADDGEDFDDDDEE